MLYNQQDFNLSASPINWPLCLGLLPFVKAGMGCFLSPFERPEEAALYPSIIFCNFFVIRNNTMAAIPARKTKNIKKS